MEKYIGEIKRVLLNRGRKDIKTKILQLVISVGLLMILISGIFSFLGTGATWYFINDRSRKSGEGIANYTKKSFEENIEDNLQELTATRVKIIDSELRGISYDTNYIAHEMTKILNSPERYSPRILPDTRRDRIKQGEVYAHYTKSVAENFTPQIQSELYLVSNAADFLKTIHDAGYLSEQAEEFVATESGLLISIDNLITPGEYEEFSEDFLDEFDPREREWYKLAKEKGKVSFTDVYLSADGAAISCGMPIYVGKEFFGVAGIAMSTSAIYELAIATQEDDENINFVLSQSGKIMMSSQTDGMFAADMEKDLRQSSESSLAQVAKKMIAGETGIDTIEIDGSEYFLSYAPIETTNWSFGIILSKKEANEPAEEVRNQILIQMDKLKSDIGTIFL